MKTNLPIALATAALALGAPAAGAATLHGTTKDGEQITLKRSGSQVAKIKTMVSTMCVETTGSGYTRAGGELFRPPGSFALGGSHKAKKLQPAAMNQGIKATKNYTVELRGAKGGGVRGKLSLNFSFLIPDLYRSLPYMYSCVGSTTFTAR
jgi:hypothetical protein